MADSSSKRPLAWQAEYLSEYKRTTGRKAEFGPMEAGGWCALRAMHSDGLVRGTRVRRGIVQQMTDTLRARPDFTKTATAVQKESNG